MKHKICLYIFVKGPEIYDAESPAWRHGRQSTDQSANSIQAYRWTTWHSELSILTPNVGYYEWRHIYPPAHARASAWRSLPNSDYGSRGQISLNSRRRENGNVCAVSSVFLINLGRWLGNNEVNVVPVISCNFRMYICLPVVIGIIFAMHEFLF